jgi:fructose-1,6-bisphosphatase/inositol monophosphatase family enzyme
LAVIVNPTTGEVVYANSSVGARLVKLGTFGEADVAADLPLGGRASSRALLNIQPTRGQHAMIADALTQAERGNFGFVKVSGGSPSWALCEAARGRFSYVNVWSDRVAAPYDLVPGTLVVRAAGGDVVDLRGDPIDAASHSGPFVASLSEHSRQEALDLLSRHLKD